MQEVEFVRTPGEHHGPDGNTVFGVMKTLEDALYLLEKSSELRLYVRINGKDLSNSFTAAEKIHEHFNVKNRMKHPTIITISGLAGAGKSTLASLMQKRLESLGKKAVILNFGDFPKMAVAEFFNVPVEELFGTHTSTAKKNKARHFLIAYAQGIKNFSGADYWAKMMVEKIQTLSDHDFIIIGDLRFQEELNALNELPGELKITLVERLDVIPREFDWLILGYYKGFLEANQLYQYHNIKSEDNPMAFMRNDSFDYVFKNTTEGALFSKCMTYLDKIISNNQSLKPNTNV